MLWAAQTHITMRIFVIAFIVSPRFEVDTKYLLLTHATNERIPVDCMEGALKFFKRYIKYMSKE